MPLRTAQPSLKAKTLAFPFRNPPYLPDAYYGAVRAG